MTSYFWKKATFHIKTSRLSEYELDLVDQIGVHTPHDYLSEMQGEIFAELAIAPYHNIWRIFHVPTSTQVGLDCASKSSAKKAVEYLINSGLNFNTQNDILSENNITFDEFQMLLFQASPADYYCGIKIWPNKRFIKNY